MSENADKKLLSNLNVLVADDDEHMRALAVTLLRDMGIKKITNAENGEDAIDKYCDACDAKAEFNLVICDWTMPLKDGLDVLKAVRDKQPNVAFVMLTAQKTMESVLEAKQKGISAYIAKPFSTSDFDKIIRRVIK